MPNYKEIARLKESGLSIRMIAKSTGCSRVMVTKALKYLQEKELDYSSISEMSDLSLQTMMNSDSGNSKRFALPDYEKLAKELSKPGVTMSLLWEEYTDQCLASRSIPYKHTQFKQKFSEYLQKHEYTEVIHHKAGESIEVDWVGNRPQWQDPDTGEIVSGWMFVGVLSFSGLCYAEVTANMNESTWIKCHVNMYEYFGGVTSLLICDNLKTGVISHPKHEEAVINKMYQALADHYNTAIIPARIRTPKDKPLVENTVRKLETYVIGKLRNYQFFSLAEYNKQTQIEVDKFNQKPFQKKEGSRRSVYEDLEKECLKPLPLLPFEVFDRTQAKVYPNSHISYHKNYYSVPYQQIGKTVNLRIYADHLDIYDPEQNLLCTHKLFKTNQLGQYDTDVNHMPATSGYGQWNAKRYLGWASSIGPNTLKIIQSKFAQGGPEQKWYNSVHSILKLTELYSPKRVETACQSCLERSIRPSHQNIKALIEENNQVKNDCEPEKAFLRGIDYYENH